MTLGASAWAWRWGVALWCASLWPSVALLAHPVGVSPWSCATTLKDSDPRDFTFAAQRVMPSVVSVASGERVKGKFTLKRAGTGVIWSEGIILTSAHITEGQSELRARTFDRRVVLLREVAKDEQLDISLLMSVNESSLGSPPPIPKSVRPAQVGMWIAAVGHPYDMAYSLSVGAVSALGRGAELREWKGRFPGFIQTDLTLNPGNSGGPLIGACGEMLGLNTAVLGAAQGVSLSLPLSRLTPVIERLLREGRFERSYAGLTLKYVSFKHSAHAQLPPRTGVRVKRVVSDGPGYLAALKVNDVIIEADGVAYHDANELSWKLVSTPAYQPVQLKVVRAGEDTTETLDVTLTPWTLADKQNRHTVPLP